MERDRAGTAGRHMLPTCRDFAAAGASLGGRRPGAPAVPARGTVATGSSRIDRRPLRPMSAPLQEIAR